MCCFVCYPKRWQYLCSPEYRLQVQPQQPSAIREAESADDSDRWVNQHFLLLSPGLWRQQSERTTFRETLLQKSTWNHKNGNYTLSARFIIWSLDPPQQIQEGTLMRSEAVWVHWLNNVSIRLWTFSSLSSSHHLDTSSQTYAHAFRWNRVRSFSFKTSTQHQNQTASSTTRLFFHRGTPELVNITE